MRPPGCAPFFHVRRVVGRLVVRESGTIGRQGMSADMVSKGGDTAPIDYEGAADIFISAFPGASLAKVYERAVSGAQNAELLGFKREAAALRETAAVIRRRIAN